MHAFHGALDPVTRPRIRIQSIHLFTDGFTLVLFSWERIDREVDEIHGFSASSSELAF